MKTGLLYLGLVWSTLVVGVAYGSSEPKGVPWAEWGFASDFDAAHEVSADKGSDPDSLIRFNPASAAISISGGKVVFTQTGPADFLRVDIDDLVANRGGEYVNEYTMIFDLKATDADWLPIYNTGYNNYNAADFWVAADGSVGSGSYSGPGAVPLETWVRLAVVRRLEGNSWVRDVYVDGTKVLDNLGAETLDDNSSLYTNAQQGEGQFTILSDSDATAYAGCALDNFAFVAAALSDEEMADLGAYRSRGIFGVAGLAFEPIPADRATDVPRDASLAWKPGDLAAAHDVYFGTAFNDVNDASRAEARGAALRPGQTGAAYDPGRLDLGRTYYWRIDEVHAAPDNTILKGDVWSFTVEPFAYPIPGVTATASSSAAGMGPENTLNGSGLDKNDLHGTEGTTMWMTSGAQPNWIQYRFDKVYKLHELKVWNSNQLIEAFLGVGAKKVTIETSPDGTTWTALANVPEFARAPGVAGYAANTTVSFGGVMAKFVKLTIHSNWGGMAAQTGLSEVRFSYVPVLARAPQPANAATGVKIDTTLTWRPGREAGSHKVFFGTDRAAVAQGTVAAQTVADHSYTPSSPNFGTTYYWRVDEVNTVTYPGEVWSFTAQEYGAIDDFESYNDDDHRIYDTWIDGLTDGKSGSIVGYDKAPFAEKTIIHGGKQSMPFEYNNVKTPSYSEATRTFDTAQNWTANGADTLALWFRGRAASFADNGNNTFTMSSSGTDIWNNGDQFRFASKQLTGDGSIVARVDSVVNTNVWAKAGVMIRQSVDAGSTHAFMPITPGGASAGNGASFQRRLTANGASTNDDKTAPAVAAPYWVKVERKGNSFTGSISPDGKTWTQLGTAQTIVMTNPVLIGLAVCSHDAALTTVAEFSNVSTTGPIAGAWQAVAIGATMTANGPAPLYLTVEDKAGKSKTVVNTNPSATTTTAWTEWRIPLSDLTGVSLTAVKKLIIGVGAKTSPKAGAAGMLYLDDIGYGHPAK